MPLESNALIQNRYRIVRLIAQGGMGSVYQAIDQRLGNTVALKQTLVQDLHLREAFAYEARLLANLHHPALPLVSDHFVEGDEQFLVMQFIPGDDLDVLLQRNGRPFALEEILRWADTLLDALDYLHTQQPPIIHRDIKPQNLKLMPRGDIILLDFGLAKGIPNHKQTSSTGQSILGYTPHYAPLEQIQGIGADPLTDLYSLGATLYHLLTGQMPPDALARAATVVRGEADPLQPADAINSQIPPDVAAVVHQAMAQNPAHRPADAATMRAMLKQARSTHSAMSSPALRIDSGGKPTVLISQPQPTPAPPVQPASTPSAVPSPVATTSVRQRRRTCFSIMLALSAAIVATAVCAVLLLVFPVQRQSATFETSEPAVVRAPTVPITATIASLYEEIPVPSTEPALDSEEILVPPMSVEIDPQEPGRSRANPLPFNEVATITDWEMTVLDIMRGDEAWQRLELENQYIDVPEVEGMEYLLVRLEVFATFTDDGRRRVNGSQFAVTGSSGVEYDRFSPLSIEPSLNVEMFTGGRASGWLPFLIRTDEESLILVQQDFSNFEDSAPWYIALEEEAAIDIDPEFEKPTANNLGTTRLNAAPLGETAVSAKWEITVLETMRGNEAWQFIQANDEYADPPEAGQEYIAAKLAVRYHGVADGFQSTSGLANFRSVGSENVVYDPVFGVTLHPEMDVAFYPGGAFEGWVVVKASEGETQMVLIFDPDIWEESTRFLSLESL